MFSVLVIGGKKDGKTEKMTCKTSTKKCPKNVISNVESFPTFDGIESLDKEHNTISNKMKRK